ncbi:hypothetical protein ABB37_09110 [Leptomonas pyrrhocoris]|uniref:Uncharacterized protein n=1 Tax=Leptomonas pyrrhocoris TaxID=157538 RepID=A0A0M9FRE9_LEPPY|nr:hypothetical protein ABB37_09110 [Leptomonas pyrrhocoris]KPA74409.1 hypothetical protein ABB37_09110 [Leptomonas pyrrhocoris]|eukprot:XP_015652848.1 hypothetical protein ABB37_09110 [Leptomonas pyrrhocoris]
MRGVSSVVVVALVACWAVFSAFALLLTYLYIEDRLKARRRLASLVAGREERGGGLHRRRRECLPAALPAPDDFSYEDPPLGNVVIKDETTLAAWRLDLVAVVVPVHACDAVHDEEGEAKPHDGQRGPPADREMIELLDTRMFPAEGATHPSHVSIPRDVHASSWGGGYVIVECEVPSPLSATSERSKSSTVSSFSPRDEEMMETDDDAAASAKGPPSQYFRFQPCPSPYGTSQYFVGE